MNVEQIEALLKDSGVSIAVRQRFAFDTGSLLRLDNYVIINVFDDGRYYFQGNTSEEFIARFSRVETPWDPEKWDGAMPQSPRQGMTGP